MLVLRPTLRPFALAALTELAVLPLPGCGREVVTSGGETTLVYARGKMSPGFDPAEETDGESALVFSNVFDTLLVHPYGEPVALEPGLATSWTWSADHRALTLKVRTG